MMTRILFASTTMLLASALCAGGVAAQQPHQHGKQQRGRAHARAAQPRPAQPAHARPAQPAHAPARAQRRPSSQAQQRQVEAARRSQAAYQAALNREVAAEQQRAARLRQERRRAQYTAQQQYLANLRAQQQRLRAERAAVRERRVLVPPAYRYRRAGVYRETNTYGAQALRRAVQLGYQQGYRAGHADQDDRARFDYRENYAYQDANYGYEGLYVPQSDYDYYFREGFRRGYDDGFYSRDQYGTLLNGAPSILAGVLGSILGLIPLH